VGLLGGRLLREADSLERGVQLAAVDELGCVAVSLGALHVCFSFCAVVVTGQRGPSHWDGRRAAQLMVMPIERAVPAMIFTAASMSFAFRSSILVAAISRTWASVRVPTFCVCGTPEPLATPAAFLMSSAAGGDFVMKVKERSS